MNESVHEFPKSIGNTATNALIAVNITTVDQVSKMSDKELLSIHGVGPKAVNALREQIRIVRDL